MRTDADHPPRVRDPAVELPLSHAGPILRPKGCQLERVLWTGLDAELAGMALSRIDYESLLAAVRPCLDSADEREARLVRSRECA